MSAPTSTAQEHFTQAARAGQEAVTTLVRSWGEVVQAAMGMPAGRTEAPRPDRVVDAWFEVAEEALEAQREFTKALFSLGDPAFDAMTRAAQRTIEATEHYTESATEQTQRSVRALAEQGGEAVRNASEETGRAAREAGEASRETAPQSGESTRPGTANATEEPRRTGRPSRKES